MSESSFRKTVEFYTGLGLIRRLISAHMRSHSRSNDFFYHTFALVRDSSIILCKLNHCDCPTPCKRDLYTPAFEFMPIWVQAGMVNEQSCWAHATHAVLYLCESVSGQGVRCLHSRTSVYHIPAFKPSLFRDLRREILENFKNRKHFSA